MAYVHVKFVKISGSVAVAESQADKCAQASTWNNHQKCLYLRDTIRVCFEKRSHSSGEYHWTGSPTSFAFPYLLCSQNYKLLGPISERDPVCRAGPWILKSSQQLEFVLISHDYSVTSFFIFKNFVTTLLRYNSHTIHSHFFRALLPSKNGVNDNALVHFIFCFQSKGTSAQEDPGVLYPF